MEGLGGTQPAKSRKGVEGVIERTQRPGRHTEMVSQSRSEGCMSIEEARVRPLRLTASLNLNLWPQPEQRKSNGEGHHPNLGWCLGRSVPPAAGFDWGGVLFNDRFPFLNDQMKHMPRTFDDIHETSS